MSGVVEVAGRLWKPVDDGCTTDSICLKCASLRCVVHLSTSQSVDEGDDSDGDYYTRGSQ
jgi:hypothetical protein